jgi:hypothetical protein
VAIDGHQSSFAVLGGGTGTAKAPVSGALIAIMLVGVLVLATIVVLLLTRRRPA